MKRIHFLSSVALIGLAAFGMSSVARAQAQNVDVDITIDAEGVAILDYFASIDVVIAPADLATLQGAGGTCVTSVGKQHCYQPSPGLRTSSVGAGGSQDSELVTDGGLVLPIPAGALSNVRLDVDNVWAVRAIGGLEESTTVTVLPTLAKTLTNATTSSTIQIGTVKGYSMQGGSADDEVSFTDPGLAVPHYGGVQLTLDLSNALTPGVYSTTVGGETDANFTIEITGT